MRLTDAVRVGAAVLLAALALAVATFSLRGMQSRRGTYVVRVDFPNALGIQKGAPVRVRGVDMGTVDDIGLGANAQAELKLRISKEYQVTPRDSIRISGGLL